MSGLPAIVISGRIDSGKSSVAEILAGSLDLPVVSFGAFIRSKSAPNASREQLQELGAELLATLGPSGFVEAVAQFHNLDFSQAAIWEGLRHRTVYVALRSAYLPIDSWLVYLHPPEKERLARARADAGDDARLSSWESHATEQIEDLADDANLCVTASRPAVAASQVVASLPAQSG